MVTNTHNFDSETLLAFFYDDRIGTINRLSNHHELENHVHAKTCAVHFMRNHACAKISFDLFLSIEETEAKPFTFQIFAMVPKLTAKIKRQEQYKILRTQIINYINIYTEKLRPKIVM